MKIENIFLYRTSEGEYKKRPREITGVLYIIP